MPPISHRRGRRESMEGLVPVTARQLQSDLAWLANAEPLFAESSGNSVWASPFSFSDYGLEERLRHADWDRLASTAQQQLKSWRVGDYFETLVAIGLAELGGVQVLVHGQQIQGAGRTLGEVDFLFRDASGCSVHLETATKFFLVNGNRLHDGPLSFDDLVGPDPRDTLAQKLRRLRYHQFPIATQAGLTIDRQALLLLGRVHYHCSQSWPYAVLADGEWGGLNVRHARGIWCRRGELEEQGETFRDALFCQLEKPFWFTVVPNDRAMLPWEALRDASENHFADSDQAMLWAIMENRPGYKQPVESNRLFIVNDTWPDPPGS